MNEVALYSLAEYLSGPLVGYSSIALEMDGAPRKRAEMFFQLRDDFGIRGYVTREQAADQIRAAMSA